MNIQNKLLKAIMISILSTSTIFLPLTANATSRNQNLVFESTKVILTQQEEIRAERLAKDMLTMQAISIAIGDKKRALLMQTIEPGQKISIKITYRELKKINILLSKQGLNLLPVATKSLDVTASSYIINIGNSNMHIFSSRSIGGTSWKIAKCAGYLGAAILPASKAYKAIKALGGIKETARLLVGAGNKKDFINITGGIGAQIIGIDGVIQNCTF